MTVDTTLKRTKNMGICLQNNAPMQVTTKKGADGKYINHAIPKLVYPNKPNGERYDEENPF